MCIILLVMAYLACVGQARRLHCSYDVLPRTLYTESWRLLALPAVRKTLCRVSIREALNPRRALAMLLRSLSLAAAFNPPGPCWHSGASNGRSCGGRAVMSDKMHATWAPTHVERRQLERTMRVLHQLQVVHELRRKEYISPSLRRKIGNTNFDTPTYKKLFTHETWSSFSGLGCASRWKHMLLDWKGSSILRAVLPISMCVTLWAAIVPTFCNHIPMNPIPLHLMGGAIGLILAFRNDAAYKRLAEARALFGRIITLGRELTTGAVLYFKTNKDDTEPSEAAYHLCRYMAIFGWVFKARLRDGEDAGDVVRAVLPEKEAAWLLSQRSPAVSLIGRMRKLCWHQLEAGNIPDSLHYKLDSNLRELYSVCGGCERLFTSPIPPTMTRHVVRSLALWLLAMPLGLIGSMPSLAIVGFSFAVSYVFLGIEELGIQVEQPFDILPLWQMCHLATRNVEEAVVLNYDDIVLPQFNFTSPIWD